MPLVGCGKDETPPEEIPMKTKEPPEKDDDKPDHTPDPADAGTDAARATAVGTSYGTGTPTPKKGDSIDACCSALQVQSTLARTPADKQRMRQAATICQNIAGMVKSGQTSKARALVQIRAAAGGKVPSACN